MERPAWAPEGIDLDHPNAARMYDYALGGSHNFPVDREMVERVEQMMPGSALIAHANRAFLRRAVRYCLNAGVRQFLDIGSGIPTVGSVHEVAPDSRVVYVDIDPVAVAHGRAILRGHPLATAIRGDVRGPAEILADPEVARMVDFSAPVAVLMIAILHFVPDEDDPAGLVRTFGRALAPGSFLALSHGTPEDRPDDADTVGQLYRATSTPLHLRTRSQVEALFGDFVPVEPGVTWLTAWHPELGDDDDGTERKEMLGGVGRRS